VPGFRITANQVTVARLLPMPILSWWCYQALATTPPEPAKMVSAIIIGTVIGATDFVDGFLARRQGPTVLGGLLDPIADKVFVAFCYLPFADEGYIAWWACGLMFVREFLVTALRSAYEQRSLSLKTSYLAKAKTWTQMQGIGVIMLFPVIDPGVMTWLLYGGIVLPLVLMLAWYAIKRRWWRGALFMSLTFAAIALVNSQGNYVWSMRAIMYGVVAITWISAFDYFAIGMKQLRGRGDVGRQDMVRIIGALLVPALVFAVLARTPAPPWPLLAILAVELAVGGLDNLLSHHKHASSALAWGSRVMGTSALLGAALALPDYATALAIAAAVVSTLGVAWEFWRGKDDYLDARIRNQAIRKADAAAPPQR
jgi:CDP-diacylglycerol--glycerol-3-phosphate 3-phosphatidyltransferase